MDLNTLWILGVVSLICYLVYTNQQITTSTPNLPRFLWNEQVGRSKQIQSKNGDASMNVEMVRRRAIQSSANKLRESRTASGASTGAVEAYMLSSICPLVCKKTICPCDVVFDGGSANANFCPVPGDTTYDAGGSGIECPPDILFDGGSANANFCPIPGTASYNAGGATTRVCGI